MKKTLFLLLLSVFIREKAKAQSYFQQKVQFEIEVSLDDNKHLLHGFETIQYTNHADSSLHELWFHLWPNAYKNRQTAFAKQEVINNNTKFYFSSPEMRGGIDSLNFQIEGKPVRTEQHDDFPDIIRLIPVNSIQPGETVTITTPFRVKIPSSDFSRLGHSGQQYQLCQWYPKPAVYDRYGWHPMPYLNQGEFYSEFGDYKVSITLPENYVLAATGNMDENPEEEMRIQENIRNTDRLIKEGFPVKDPFPASSEKMKTVVYRQKNVHDFAWFADKRYHIMVGEARLNENKSVDTYAYFCNKNANEWSKATSYANDVLQHYSKWIGEYPYDVCKVVDGALSAGAGMEYPTITVIAYPGSAKTLDRVIAHEIGHNWFYGILASNERTYPWMDEGMNSYYEKRYMSQKYHSSDLFEQLNQPGLKQLLHLNDVDSNALDQLIYQFLVRRNSDQAVYLPAADFMSANYAGMVYEKTAALMKYLASWMGQEKFDAMMQDYYQSWKFKHPYPDDFRKIAEQHAGQDLSWWFNDLLGSRKRIDYAIIGIHSKEGNVRLKIKNKGQISAPFTISRIDTGASIISTSWHSGFTGKQRIVLHEKSAYKYRLNADYVMPDIDNRNDAIRSKGLFKRSRPLKPQFLTGFESPKNSSIYFLPAIAYNMYNGFMAGMIFHNIGILRKQFEFTVMPLYGFGDRSLAGNINADYFIRPVGGFLKSITLNASASRYGLARAPYYDRFVTSVSFVLKNNNPVSKIKKEILVRHIQIEYTPYYQLSPAGIVPGSKRSIGYNQLLFSIGNKRKLNPYNWLFDVQQGDGFVKSSLTAKYFFAYNKVNRGLSVRFFAGTFLWKTPGFKNNDDVRFRLSGHSGNQDYLFDDVFIGRQEYSGFWSQQMTESDGGFKVYSYRGQTLDYLMALNLKSGLPGKIPVKLFADLGYYFNDEPDRDPVNYCAGAILSIIPDAVEVYFPLLISDNIRKTMSLNPGTKNYGQQIRFVLNLKLANPVKLLRNFEI